MSFNQYLYLSFGKLIFFQEVENFMLAKMIQILISIETWMNYKISILYETYMKFQINVG